MAKRNGNSRPQATDKRHSPGSSENEWDPLLEETGDPDILARAKKREIQNILKSYTGYYDLFAELLQNALDAVEKRGQTEGKKYKPEILVKIDLTKDSLAVIDNG